MPVIVSGCKPACWHCDEIGHLSAVCLRKKAPKTPDHARDTFLFSAYFDGRSRGVTRLISKRLISTCTLVLSDPSGKLCILHVTIKDKVFRLIGVYGPTVVSELSALFGASSST